MEVPRVLRVLLVERTCTAIGPSLDRSRPRRFEIARASSCDEALELLARVPIDALLVDVAALEPCEAGHLQRLTAAAPNAAVVALSAGVEPNAREWLEAGVHETVPLSCVLSPCGSGIDLLRRALFYAWEHKRAETRLADLALRDALTDLPNRRAFDGLLAGALARARRHRTQLAVLFLDLDGFKAINDGIGHAAGDRVLREVAARLRAGLRESDLVARIGGDEFLVVVEDIRSPHDADVVAEKLRLAIARPMAFGAKTVRCTASVGVAIGPEGRDEPEALIAAADAAMFGRKRARRARLAAESDAKAARDTCD